MGSIPALSSLFLQNWSISLRLSLSMCCPLNVRQLEEQEHGSWDIRQLTKGSSRIVDIAARLFFVWSQGSRVLVPPITAALSAT